MPSPAGRGGATSSACGCATSHASPTSWATRARPTSSCAEPARNSSPCGALQLLVRRAIVLAAALAGALAAAAVPAAAAPQPLAPVAVNVPISAAGGWVAWSAPVAGGGFGLFAWHAGAVAQVPVAPRPQPFDLDLGTDAQGRPVATFSRCAVAPVVLAG